MTLPASGPISFSQINAELGLSSTAQINMGRSDVRGLFAKGSGAISMSDGRGRSAAGVASTFTGTWTFESTTADGTGSNRATILMGNNGVLSIGTNDNTGIENWYTPPGGQPGNNFWCKATQLSGPALNGTFGAWMQLNVDRSWGGAYVQSEQSATVWLKIELSPNSSGSPIVATKTVTATITAGAY